MGIGFYLGFIMRCKSTRAWLNIDPSFILITHFAFLTFAGVADEMSAFIAADPLPADLLVADSTYKSIFDFFYYEIS